MPLKFRSLNCAGSCLVFQTGCLAIAFTENSASFADNIEKKVPDRIFKYSNKMNTKFILSKIALLSTLVVHAEAHEHVVSRPDSHAPISIMGDHTHKEGEWMASYRYMYMSMDGMRSGERDLDLSEVFMSGYTVSPESMDMEMHMLGVMYAVSDKLTLVGMANYSEIEMSHRINPMARPLVAANGEMTLL